MMLCHNVLKQKFTRYGWSARMKREALPAGCSQLFSLVDVYQHQQTTLSLQYFWISGLYTPMEDPYASVPLAYGASTNIRLVELELTASFNESEPISCMLHTVALENAPPYEALSYVWGDPN